MLKTTKALAALGVVAGLGIAALPLGASAAKIIDGPEPATNPETGAVYDGTKDGKVEDTVTVRTTIEDTLTLTIVGANDDAIGDGGESHLVLLGTDGILKNGSDASGTATVNVATNSFGGYKVFMKGSGGFKNLTHPTEEFADVATDAAGVAAFPTTGSYFGYQTTAADTVTNLQLANGNWNGVLDAETQIATGTGATVLDGDTFTITFKAQASESQAAGTYQENITITATADLVANASSEESQD